MECKFCKSTNTRKNGFTRQRVQRYYCKDCNKRFTESTKIEEYIKEECPYCHSSNSVRAGKLRYGDLRYRCKDCGKYFSKNTVIREPLNISCPKCNSNSITRSGYNSNRVPRYYCKDCGYKFITNPPIRKQHEKTCPKCGHPYAKKGGKSSVGTQYWVCLSCKYKYNENPIFTKLKDEDRDRIKELINQGLTVSQIGKELNRNPRIIRYNINKLDPQFLERVELNRLKEKEEIHKNSKLYQIQQDKINRQKERQEREEELKQKSQNLYEEGKTKEAIAKELNINIKKITKYTKNFKTTNQLEKEAIRKLVLKGWEVKKVAKKFNISSKEMSSILKRTYLREVITPEQENLIIKFGVCLNVPVEYLAEYVPCSRHKCNEIINKYIHLRRNIKRKPLTEEDIASDKRALDKFVR